MFSFFFFCFLDRFLGRVLVFLFSYFLVFFYKFPPQIVFFPVASLLLCTLTHLVLVMSVSPTYKMVSQCQAFHNLSHKQSRKFRLLIPPNLSRPFCYSHLSPSCTQPPLILLPSPPSNFKYPFLLAHDQYQNFLSTPPPPPTLNTDNVTA